MDKKDNEKIERLKQILKEQETDNQSFFRDFFKSMIEELIDSRLEKLASPFMIKAYADTIDKKECNQININNGNNEYMVVNNLKQAIKQSPYNQKEIAQKIGISEHTL